MRQQTGHLQNIWAVEAKIFRMTDPVSMRALAAKRWGSQRPTRLAREVAERIHELPEAERVRLMNALTLAHPIEEKRQP